MKNIIYYFSILFGVFTLASCDPSQDSNGDFLIGVDYNPNTGTGGTGTTTSRLLRKMISHTKDDNGQFEDETLIFNYTNNKMVGYTDAASGQSLKIDYNSSGKISKIYAGSDVISTFTYSGTNVSKITTVVAGFSTLTATFTYNGSKLSKSVIIFETTIIPSKGYTEDNYTYSGNNIVKDVTTIGVYDPITGELIISPDSVTANYEYDSKKSPYTLLPKEFLLYLASISPQTAFYNSTNNPLKTVITNQSGATDTSTVLYTYDSENYATKATSGDEYYIYEY